MAKLVCEGEIKAGGLAVGQLRSLGKRTECLEEEHKALVSDIRDMSAEASPAGC